MRTAARVVNGFRRGDATVARHLLHKHQNARQPTRTFDRDRRRFVIVTPGPGSSTDMDRTMTLLARYRSGDRAALQTLFERYYLRVLRLVRIELGTAPPPGQEVADVLQEVFVRILEGLEGYEPRTDAQWISWVATLARNRIANLRRDAHAAKRGGGRRPQSIQTESGSYISAIADSSGIVAKVALTEDMERIDACVNQLTGDQREVVLQRDYQGASWKEIASRMERSTKACEQLHRRARAELSRLFRE